MSIMQQPGAVPVSRPSTIQPARRTSRPVTTQRLDQSRSSNSVYPFAVMRRLMGEMERVNEALPDLARYDLYQDVFEQVRWSSDLEVFTRGDDLVLRATLPGVKPEDWEVHLEDGVLSICSERRSAPGNGDGARWRSPEANEQFVRRLTVPPHVREEDVKCAFDEGVLEISFPGA